MHSSVPEFLRTFKKKKRTRSVTSGGILKMQDFKRCSTVQKDQWAEMQNDMKSPALLANFISGGHAFNLMMLKCNYFKLVRKGI